jgi:hypothetical protein
MPQRECRHVAEVLVAAEQDAESSRPLLDRLWCDRRPDTVVRTVQVGGAEPMGRYTCVTGVLGGERT